MYGKALELNAALKLNEELTSRCLRRFRGGNYLILLNTLQLRAHRKHSKGTVKARYKLQRQQTKGRWKRLKLK